MWKTSDFVVEIQRINSRPSTDLDTIAASLKSPQSVFYHRPLPISDSIRYALNDNITVFSYLDPEGKGFTNIPVMLRDFNKEVTVEYLSPFNQLLLN